MATKTSTTRRRSGIRRAGVRVSDRSVPQPGDDDVLNDDVLTVENSDDYVLDLCSRHQTDGKQAAAIVAGLSGSRPE